MKLQQFAAFAVAIFVSFANGDTSPQDLALRMLASIENRGQATIDSGASTGFIQLVCQYTTRIFRLSGLGLTSSLGALLASSRCSDGVCSFDSRKRWPSTFALRKSCLEHTLTDEFDA